MSPLIKPPVFHKWPELADELQLEVLQHVKKLVDVINTGAANKNLRSMMNDNSRIPNWIEYGVKPPVSFSGMQKSVITKVQSFDPYVQVMVLNLEELPDIFSKSFGKMNQSMVLARRYAAKGDVETMKNFLKEAAENAKNSGLEEAPSLSNEELKSAYLKAVNRSMETAKQYAVDGDVYGMAELLEDAAHYAKNAGLEKAPSLSDEELKSAYLKRMQKAMMSAKECAENADIPSMNYDLNFAADLKIVAKHNYNVDIEIPCLPTENMNPEVKNAYVLIFPT